MPLLKCESWIELRCEWQEQEFISEFPGVTVLTLYTDPDWRTDQRTRRSFSCGLSCHGKTLDATVCSHSTTRGVDFTRCGTLCRRARKGKLCVHELGYLQALQARTVFLVVSVRVSRAKKVGHEDLGFRNA